MKRSRNRRKDEGKRESERERKKCLCNGGSLWIRGTEKEGFTKSGGEGLQGKKKKRTGQGEKDVGVIWLKGRNLPKEVRAGYSKIKGRLPFQQSLGEEGKGRYWPSRGVHYLKAGSNV